MKKQIKGLLVISLIIVLGACSKQEKQVRREVSKDINTELVKKVTGAWLGEGEKEKKIYDITYKKKALWINQEELEVTETKDNLVLTQTKKEKPFFYDFKIEGENITVMPSYPVPEGQSGGQLAPIKLIPIDTKEIEVHNSEKDELINFEETLKTSLDMFERKETFLLKMTRFTTEGDPIFEMLSFNGEEIYYYYDNSKDKFGEKNIVSASYKNWSYEEKIDETNHTIKEFILSEPVEKDSEKQVVFDIQNLE
jgi:hypothetical protein